MAFQNTTTTFADGTVMKAIVQQDGLDVGTSAGQKRLVWNADGALVRCP